MAERTIWNNRLIEGEKLDNAPADTISELALKEDKADKWQVDWYAELDSSWKVPVAQLPSWIVAPVDSVNWQTWTVVLDADDIDDTSTTNKYTTAWDISKLAWIDAWAEVNNISDANATDLTDWWETTLHTHPWVWDVTASANLWDNLLIRWDWATKWVQNSWITVDDNDELAWVSALQYITSYIPASIVAGLHWWNEDDVTLNIATWLWPILQVWQEMYTIIYNWTGWDLDNWTVVYPVWQVWGRPSIDKSMANTHEKITRPLYVLTMDIPDGTFGIWTSGGFVRGIDTTWFGLWTEIYLSPTVEWGLQSEKPEFPNYDIRIGWVTKTWELDWEIFVAIDWSVKDTIVNFWNWVFRETFNFRITSDWATITWALSPANWHPDMTMIFSDWFTMLETTPDATIELTAWADDNPQTNYVYILKSAKVLDHSTSSFPTAEHIKVAQIALKTASVTEIDWALRNQNINDAVENTNTFQGHLSHITNRLRQENAKWDSWASGSVDITAWAVYVKNTSGVVYQMHRQVFPILDMNQYGIDAVSTWSKTFTISWDWDLSSTFPDGRTIKVNDSTGNDWMYTIASTLWSSPNFIITVEETIADATVDGTIWDDIHIVNDFTTPYRTETDLAQITLDASWDAVLNTSFSVVVWGVANKSWEESHLMANMPTWTYNKNFPEQAVDDGNATSVYSIPKQFQWVGFLIARFTFVDTAWVWSLFDTQDLRWFVPNTTAWWGWWGWGWVTEWTSLNDTPNSFIWEARKIVNVNAWETALEFTDAPTISNANITEATDKNYVTDADAVVIWNTSNTNTWDEIVATWAELDTWTDDAYLV